MGYRITQRIIECSGCGRIPEDGEYLWDMSSAGYLCERCINIVDEDDNVPEIFPGTRKALDELGAK